MQAGRVTDLGAVVLAFTSAGTREAWTTLDLVCHFDNERTEFKMDVVEGTMALAAVSDVTRL